MMYFLIEIFNVKCKNSDLECSKKSRPFKIGLVTYTYHNALSPLANQRGGEVVKVESTPFQSMLEKKVQPRSG